MGLNGEARADLCELDARVTDFLNNFSKRRTGEKAVMELYCGNT